MIHRLLPIGLIIALITFIGFNLQAIRREIAYNPLTKEFALATGISNDRTTACCNLSENINTAGKFDESDAIAIFNNQVVDYPKTSLAYYATSQEIQSNTAVLGVQAISPSKWIEVSLTEQKLRAWDGNTLAMEFPISSGKWYPTPKGDFKIWYKTRSQTMTGGSKELGTFYYLPGVPFSQFFNGNFAIHGAYWHNNFGQPMSHGCVNAPIANAAQLFEWAGPYIPPGENVVRASNDNPGTRVYVH